MDDNLERKRIGSNFLGILNDLKRRPEDAAQELNISVDEINDIIAGKKHLSQEIINRATDKWPVNARDFYLMHDDCPNGIKVMRAEDSEKTSRIMNRAGYSYYEYRDTAMSSVAPFRPEWIKELCIVGDNHPENPDIQWNNGHFMHQFTYFMGDVNFYYKSANGEKKVAIMNTGDSMYITPFVSHTFATRKGAEKNGLILALTYGSKLTGDVQQELSSLSHELGSEFALDFSTKESAAASLLTYHRENASLTIEELSQRTNISVDKLQKFEGYQTIPSYDELKIIANALYVNTRDLMSNDKIEEKVIIKHHDSKKWYYPETTKSYEFVELASTTTLPYSKAFEITIQKDNDKEMDIKVGLHQYVYNVGDTCVTMNWRLNNQHYEEIINPGDSVYIKPFVSHNFRKKGKLLVLRVGGKIVGDPQIELSFVGKENTKRAISETMQWFDPEGKN